jgi:hypothetical protein
MSGITNSIGPEKTRESIIEMPVLRRSAFDSSALSVQEEKRESRPTLSALDELKLNVSQLTEMHAKLRFVMREVSDLVRRV